ncbi:hypothetical protein EFK50_03665 [Nocardioides marmoriginsengisoli]|uniref:Uncharacterized protein n=1 Tax=Nocardioides marmoriginsengisoli TaxID=661483 RepID=A0A3N0CP44_9ACTN|nr:hypothetical protein [Nocardioides marmoriginsengisoli]RNL65081.1 hypothetical protein EFK50_03665 [Nocardioides marmoriginsengisoli]
MTIAALLLALAGTLPGWLLSDKTRAHLLGVLVGLGALVGLGGWTLYDPSYSADGEALRATLILLVAVLAAFGGGPVTAAVLHRVDHGGPIESAGDVLRGGAWIGAMERAAIFCTLIAGWPEGLAVVLAMKGLGRYPELKQPGAAERFIIGSFVSVLWAIACAGLLLGLLN